MRDNEYALSLLREMADAEDGRLLAGRYYGAGGDAKKRQHHIELLEDAGHAIRIGDFVRITTDGYDFISAVDKQPKAMDKFQEWVNAGVPYAQAAVKAVDFVSKLVG